MQKPQQVRHIYHELKAALGETMPADELLECASLIVDAATDTLSDGGVYHTDGRIPLCEMPVDEVISRWSWDLVEYDYNVAPYRDQEFQDDYMAHIPDDIKWQELLMAA